VLTALQDQFIIGVPADINYLTLRQKVLKKVRMCSSSAATRGEMLQLKWIDADDDEVAIKCDDDIEAMFGETKESGATCVNIVAR
jgi:cell division control protein 24